MYYFQAIEVLNDNFRVEDSGPASASSEPSKTDSSDLVLHSKD